MGIWKNVEDLEESLNLYELQLVVTAGRKRQHEDRKFAAALKGINLDEPEEDSEAKFERIQRNAEARISGKSIESLELDDFGLDFEED